MKKRKSILLAALTGAAIFSGFAKETEISVLQFNIWQEGTTIPGGFDAIVDEIARLNPDFVTLSEVRNYHGTRFCDRITDALKKKGHTYHSFYSYDTGLLSKYEITDSATVFPHNNDHGTIYRLDTEVDGKKVVVYTGHLDYLNDTYYEVRGYDGNHWKPMPEPLTDVEEILRRNALSQRDEAIDSLLNNSRDAIESGALIFFGGDFNEPSHLDWTEATKDMAEHHGVVIDWPATKRLHDAGFRDAYRTIYPDPVTHPGYTYPSDNKALPPSKITWAPNADERDRIDYVFFYPRPGLEVTEASILGPKTSIAHSQRIEETGDDTFIEPIDVWPTDHKGVLIRFRYTSD